MIMTSDATLSLSLKGTVLREDITFPAAARHFRQLSSGFHHFSALFLALRECWWSLLATSSTVFEPEQLCTLSEERVLLLDARSSSRPEHDPAGARERERERERETVEVGERLLHLSTNKA
jgi:hypothetical protein